MIETVKNDDRKGWTTASNAAADALCPARHLAQKGIPEPAKTEDADSGSRIHRALATGDVQGLTFAELETYDACRKIAMNLVSEFFDKIEPAVFAEQRFWGAFGVKGKEHPHSGQPDVVFRHGVRALVLHYKSLAGDVAENPRNLQLRDLAVLVWGSLPPVSEVGVAIVQPLVTHTPDICLYSEQDLKRAEQELATRVSASNNPQSHRVAGELQCKFCLAKTSCAAYSSWIGSMLPVKSAEDALRLEMAFQVPMKEWNSAQRAQVANVLAPATKALEDIKDFFKDGLSKDPEFVPGWTLKPGSKRNTPSLMKLK